MESLLNSNMPEHQEQSNIIVDIATFVEAEDFEDKVLPLCLELARLSYIEGFRASQQLKQDATPK